MIFNVTRIYCSLFSQIAEKETKKKRNFVIEITKKMLAVSNSPGFSPSNLSSIFYKSSSESLKLNLIHSPKAAPRSVENSPFCFNRNFEGSTEDAKDDCDAGCALKRKRPLKLEIPILTSSDFEVVRKEKAVDEIEDGGDGYSVYCKKGRKSCLEDRYTVDANMLGESNQAFFGVFDGHGGEKAAAFAATNLQRNVIEAVTRRNEEEMNEAVEEGYLTTDEELLKAGLCGGTCCVTAFIRNGNLVVSNAGDCRAVISKDGVAQALTSDHKPSREDERSRIEAKGGYVDCCRGTWRIQGSLAVSRSIGDRSLKNWVIAHPETKIIKIIPEHEFLILASDGLWDKVSNQEAVNVVRSLGAVDDDKPALSRTCRKLTDLSISRGSTDDITVMVIQLRRYVS